MGASDPTTSSRTTRVTHRQESTGPPGTPPWTRADPFAPPGEPSGQFAAHSPERNAEVPRHEGPPAHPGVFWIVAAVGISLLLFAHLLRFFVVVDDMADEQVAPALFGVLGLVALGMGLALAAVLQRGLAVPWRIALLLGAAYVATQGSGWTSLLSFGIFS